MFKKFLETKSITADQFKELDNTAQAELQNEYLGYLETKIEKSVSKEDFDDLKKELDKVTGVDGIVSIKEEVNKLGEKINKITVTGNVNEKSFKEKLTKALVANKDKIKAFKENGTGFQLEIKSATTITTGSVDAGDVPDMYVNQGMTEVISQFEKVPFVLDLTNTAPTDRPSLAWVNQKATEGDVEMTGEGELKPLLSTSYEVEYSNAGKAAGRSKVSMEALEDIPFMVNEIERILRKRHDLKVEQQVLFGNGTGENLKGINEYASAFVAGGLADSIPSPSNWDVLMALYNQVAVATDGEANANVALVHPTDATLMKLTKDENGNYIAPPFASANGQTVNGMVVVPKTQIPIGSFLAGDFNLSNVRIYKDFVITFGNGSVQITEGENTITKTDFECNLVSVVAESRLHHYISENHETAFVKGTFAVAKEALDSAEEAGGE